jgi:hypothetical protein
MHTTRHPLRASLTFIFVTAVLLATGAPVALARPAPVGPDPERARPLPAAISDGFGWGALSIGIACTLLAMVALVAVTRVVHSHRPGSRSRLAV